jgi:hypothetical protein
MAAAAPRSWAFKKGASLLEPAWAAASLVFIDGLQRAVALPFE